MESGTALAQASAGELLEGTLTARGELCSQGICLPWEETPILAAVIMTIFSALGVVFLCLIIYAGFLWMTAGGNAEQVEKAKRILVQSVIGLAITLGSFAIATFVLSQLEQTQAFIAS